MQISPQIKKCVIFIAIQKANGDFLFVGTASLVGRRGPLFNLADLIMFYKPVEHEIIQLLFLENLDTQTMSEEIYKELITDYDILHKTFGETYYILPKLASNKKILSETQKQQLSTLVSERNHFDIVDFLDSIRN